MKHFFEQISSGKFDEGKYQSSNVVVTLKIDGTHFQIVFENGKASFHKRSEDSQSVGADLTQVDAFTNSEYYPVMKYILPILKENDGKLSGVKILNFEILSDNGDHFVKYNQKPDNDLCILNAFSDNDKPIKQSLLEQYAKVLGTGVVPVLYSGPLNDKLSSVVEFVKKNCDPHNPGNISSADFKNELFGILGISDDKSPLLDTQDDAIEGIVLTFSTSDGQEVYKIDSPDFIRYVMKNQKEEEGDDKKIEGVLNQVYSYLSKNSDVLKKYKNDIFRNILCNLDELIQKDKQCLDFLYNCAKKCEPCVGNMFNAINKDISIFPKEFRQYKNDDKFFYSFRLLIWLIGKERKSEKYPVRLKFNEFVEKIGLKKS